jgi:hypothetical protein
MILTVAVGAVPLTLTAAADAGLAAKAVAASTAILAKLFISIPH